jgi:hypothetical protein
MSKSKILLLFTNHRVAEKLWPIIPLLSIEYEIDLFCVGLFSLNTPWVGDIDERLVAINKYNQYFNNVIQGPGIKFHGDSIHESLLNFIDINSYKFVIYDDNREMQEFNIPHFYNECKHRNIKVIGNVHGNEDITKDASGISYTVKMEFHNGGIPANDTLANVVVQPQHILVITNFLGNRGSIFPINFDQRFVQESGILELSKQFNLPIKVKIKTRLDKPDYVNDISYVNNLLECEVITNSENIDDLIAKSAVVISAPSTLAFKPIQLGIPTVLIKGCGQIGKFEHYPGLVDLNKQQIFDSIQYQLDHGKFNEYLQTTISGGDVFQSSQNYVKYIKTML